MSFSLGENAHREVYCRGRDEIDSSSDSLFLMTDYLMSCKEIKLFEGFIKELETEKLYNSEAVLKLLAKYEWDGVKFRKVESVNEMRHCFSSAYAESIRTAMKSNAHITIQSYSPDTLLQLLFYDEVPVSKTSYFTCAVVFVDFSSIAQLCTALCQKHDDSKNIKEFDKIANDFIGQLISTIYGLHGDVISFEGDFLICIFRDVKQAPPEILSPYCRRAVESAMALASLEMDNCTCRVAISHGEMSLAVLGGYESKWSYLLNGIPLEQLSSCLEDAGSKEVVVSHSFFDMLMGDQDILLAVDSSYNETLDTYKIRSLRVDGEEIPWHETNGISISGRFCGHFSAQGMGLQRLLESRSTKAMTNFGEYFLPTHTDDELELGIFSTMLELHDMTILSLKLESFDTNDYSAKSSLQPFFLLIQQLVLDAGGYFEKLVITNEGCFGTAMWGMVKYDYVDNVWRALHCALQLRNKCARTLSIGVSTGRCCCGSVGSMERRSFVHMGHGVDVAKELISKANGTILLDTASYASLPMSTQSQLLHQMDSKKGGGAVYLCSPNKVSCGVTITPQLDIPLDPNVIRIYLGSELSRCLEDKIKKVDYTDRFFLLNSLSDEEYRVAVEETDEVVGGSCSQKKRSAKKITNGKKSHWEVFERQFGYNPTSIKKSKLFGSCNKQSFGAPRWNEIEAATGVPVNAVSCTLVNIPSGGGRHLVSEFVSVLAAPLNGVRCFSVAAGQYDPLFTVNRKIFFGLLSAKEQDTEQIHDKLKDLIVKTFPSLKRKKSEVAKLYDTLCTLLGIAVVRNDDNKESLSQRISNRFSKYISSSKSNIYSNHDVQFNGRSVFHSILSYMLLEQPTVLIVEDCHFCDELAWQQFLMLLDMPLCLSLFLTYSGDGWKLKEAEPVAQSSRKGFISNLWGMSESSPHVNTDKGKAASRSPSFFSALALSSSSIVPEVLNRKTPNVIATHSSLFSIVKSHTNSTAVDMPALDREFVVQLLLHNYENIPIPARIVDLICNTCCGNVCVCRSIMKQIHARGIVSFIKLINNSLSNLDTCLTLCGYSQLKANEKLFVRTAAVVGEEFSVDMVQNLLPKSAQKTLSHTIETLVQNNIIVSITGKAGCFSFKNPESVLFYYSLFPKGVVVLMHGQLADLLERRRFLNLPQVYRSLSFHNGKSSCRKSTCFKYHLLCADQCLSQYCYGDALSYLNLAKDNAETSNEHSILLRVVECGIQDMKFPPNGGSFQDQYFQEQFAPPSTPFCGLFACSSSVKKSKRQSVFDSFMGARNWETIVPMDLHLIEFENFERRVIADCESVLYDDILEFYEGDWEPTYTMMHFNAYKEFKDNTASAKTFSLR